MATESPLYVGLVTGGLTALVTLLATVLTLMAGGKAAAKVAGHLTRSVKISEFRQKWIEELRADIATYLGAAHRWIRIYQDFNSLPIAAKDSFEKSEVRPIQNEALVILYRIRMRINPLDSSPTKAEDDALLSALFDLLNPGKFPEDSFEASWIKSADVTILLARKILKREWEITKRPLKI